MNLHCRVSAYHINIFIHFRVKENQNQIESFAIKENQNIKIRPHSKYINLFLS